MAPLSHIRNDKVDYRHQSTMSCRDSNSSFDVKYKVLLLGDTLVGKTSLQRCITGKDFRPDIGSTVGIDFVNRIIDVEQSKINLQIWDTAGQKNFRTIGRGYYTSTKAFVLVYDVTNIESFRLIEYFVQLIAKAGLDLERQYLVANKIDLDEERKVDEDLGRRFALRNSMIYFETSCKTGENIQEFFERVASDLVQKHHPKLLDSHLPVINNFAFNYNVPTTIDHRLSEKLRLRNELDEEKEYSSGKPRKVSLNLRRFLICCNPRRSNKTNN